MNKNCYPAKKIVAGKNLHQENTTNNLQPNISTKSCKLSLLITITINKSPQSDLTYPSIIFLSISSGRMILSTTARTLT